MSYPLPTPILPPAMLGILGGGQLGRMFLVAAKTMGYRVTVLDPDPRSPAGLLADVHLCLPYDDAAALAEMAKSCAAVTTEFENVDADAMRWLAAHVPVSPSGDCVAIAQDRVLEKSFINGAGLPTAPWLPLARAADIDDSAAACLPGILKTARLGYDGKGQVRVTTLAELKAAFAAGHGQRCILEKMLPLASEMSVIVARTGPAQAAVFPVAENEHVGGILDISLVPARISPQLTAQAQQMALHLVETLNYIGVLAVEFFVLQDGTLVINEMAPRPHNSGHYTLDACLTSQFEQQVRAMCGLTPGRTELLKPAVMVNLLGDSWGPAGEEPDWRVLLDAPNAKLHLYGKQEARPGRKMGHFTVLCDSAEAALEQAQAIKETL